MLDVLSCCHTGVFMAWLLCLPEKRHFKNENLNNDKDSIIFYSPFLTFVLFKLKNKMRTHKILMIVDDDEDDRFFFRSAIRKNNPLYECIEAKNGEDALKQLRKAKELPDFIFLDLNMPRMDGRECLIELKKDETLKKIPVIIYSTSGYQIDINITKELGADYFLSKLSDIYPLPEELIKAMKKAVEKP